MAITPLTAFQITRLRGRLNDKGTPPDQLYSDADLEAYWQDLADESLNHLTVELINELLMPASKLHDYVQNETQEKRQQIFANLLKIRDWYYNEWNKELGDNQQSVIITGTVVVPPEPKSRPNGTDDDYRWYGESRWDRRR
jgi:hypothetical protein